MKYDICVYAVPRGISRLDVYLAEGLGLCTRNQLKQRIASLCVNGVKVKLSKKVMQKDRIGFELADAPSLTLEPQPISLDILYEDDDVLVLNKPQGLVVHPGAGNPSGTLANALLYYIDGLSNETERPGIVHRLDKETSGVLITAKNQAAHEYLSSQFREKTAAKTYLAIVRGCPPDAKGQIENNLGRSRSDRKKFTAVNHGGKKAVTRYEVLRRYDTYSFVKLELLTGRTHQLRVHMKELGCPIAGDPVYGTKADSAESLMLHAYRLSIKLPQSDVRRCFRAPLPERFKLMLRRI